MVQAWKKIGNIFNVDKSNLDWMSTHAMMPVIEKLRNNIYRIYFSTRDQQNRSRCASIDLNIKSLEVTNLTQKPILDLGAIGTFEDSGVMPTSIIKHKGIKYLYYNGWSQGKTVPFYSFIGLA